MNHPAARPIAALCLALWLAGCTHPRVRELNTMGKQAAAQRDYSRAVAYFSESLALSPDQPEIRQHLQAAQTMLRQIYTYEIYEIVDQPRRPIESFLRAWQLWQRLPSLNVEPARVATVRQDMDRRFAKEQQRLRRETEDHKYHVHLAKMQALGPSPSLGGALAKLRRSLVAQHRAARDEADRRELPGLALLHSAAAATFDGGDTSLWSETDRRRRALLHALAVPLTISVRSELGRSHVGHLEGGLKRRLPRIFELTHSAPLRLALAATRPRSDERKMSSRHSARCQVGTRREQNPACDVLRQRVASAERTHAGYLQALQTAEQRCGSAEPQRCTSYLGSARRQVAEAEKGLQRLQHELQDCPPYLEQPVYKMFFYQRFTISRSVSVAAAVTIVRDGQPWRSRGASGSAAASDSYGDGLGCAEIPADPLDLPSLDVLAVQADERLLDDSMAELLALRREKARQQLAGGDGGDGDDRRLDALVRARLVDESYRLAATQLAKRLQASWSADFDLPRRIVR